MSFKAVLLVLLISLTIPFLPSPSLIKAQTTCPIGVDPRAGGLVTSKELTGTGFTVSSDGKCVIDPETIFVPFKIQNYSDLKSTYYDQVKSKPNLVKTELTGNRTHDDIPMNELGKEYLYHISGNPSSLTITGNIQGDAGGQNQNGLVFVDQDLYIQPPLTGNRFVYGTQSSGIVFVVGGNVYIEGDVTEIDAIIIAQGTIYTASQGPSTPCDSTPSGRVVTSSPLIIKGSLIALNESNPVHLCRDLTDNTQAAEVLEYQPKYLILLRNLFSQSLQKWSEVDYYLLPSIAPTPTPTTTPSPSPSPTLPYPPSAAVYRYWSSSVGDHFYTTASGTYSGYTSQGRAFNAFINNTGWTTIVPVYRAYNASIGDHFYTIDTAELTAPGYTSQGIAFYASNTAGSGLVPVYRLVNSLINDHFYTINTTERDNALNSAYTSEGIAFYVPALPTDNISPLCCTYFPDLLPWTFWPVQSAPYWSDIPISFTASAKNLGGANASTSYGRFCYNNTNCSTGLIGTDQSLGALAINDVSPTLTSILANPPAGTPTYAYFCVDSPGLGSVAEISEANNCSSVPLYVNQRCDPNLVGTDQLVGCLYGWTSTSNYFETLHQPAPSSNPITTTANTQIAFIQNWTTANPSPTLGANNFSARWKGTYTFQPGTYQFFAESDDGVRLFLGAGSTTNILNNSGAISSWSNHDSSIRFTSNPVVYNSATNATLTLEFYEGTNLASVMMGWYYTSPFPDLVTFSLQSSNPTEPYMVGGSYTFQAVVKNQGSTATTVNSNGRFCVDNSFCYGTNTTGRIGQDVTIPPLIAFENTNFLSTTTSWTPTTPGIYTITFCADVATPNPPGAITEGSETNNCTPLVINVAPPSNPVFITNAIKSTTYYDFPYELGNQVFPHVFVEDFTTDLPKIKLNGFNTVWLVPVLRNFFADATSNILNQNAFNDLKEALSIAQANNLKVILPLSYVTRQGCEILTDSSAYQNYVNDHTLFLQQITDFAPNVYIVIFTESVWNCSQTIFGVLDYNTPSGGERMSQLIKPTLGHLPADLPVDLRIKFLFGFHDSFIPLGWNQGTSDVADPNPYDFFSTGVYSDHTSSDSQIQSNIDSMVGNIRSFYPSMPIFFGEVGSSWCKPNGANEITQAHADTVMAQYMISNGYGFNIWQWKPINFRDPDWEAKDCNFGGHSIIKADGSLRPAAQALKDLLSQVQGVSTQSSFLQILLDSIFAR